MNKILIADDEAFIRELLVTTLTLPPKVDPGKELVFGL
jgi:hypothetical protein